MKKILLFACVLLCRQAHATSINASAYGYNATDATNAFKNAVQSTYDTVVVDYVGTGVWTVGPCQFFDLANKTIIFQNNVRLEAKAGAFPDVGHCLFKLVRGNNVHVIGYGATFKMQKAEYTSGEWRHTVSINNCSNISVKGLTVMDSGGDGFLISGDTWYSTQLYSENIVIKDCISDNHRRQGISIISAQNLTVENCTFKNTVGTLPEAGVDLEPDQAHHRLVNVLFSNCQFRENNGNGIRISVQNLTSTSQPISVVFSNCYITNNWTATNAYYSTEIYANSHETDFVTGTVTFNNCTVENSQWSAVSSRKQADSYLLTFNNCHFKNVSQTQQNYNNPIWVEVVDYSNPNPAFGGLAFNNVCVEFPTNLPFIHFNGWSTSDGLANVTGNFGVVNTYQLPPVYSNINSQTNVNIAYINTCLGILSVEYLSGLTGRLTEGSILLDWATAAEQGNAYFDVEHSSDGLRFAPIGRVQGKGSTQLTQAYHFVDKTPAVGINYYRLRQVDRDGRFEYSQMVAVVFDEKDRLSVYPNPVGNSMIINGFEKIERLRILNPNGQVIKQLISPPTEIPTSDLPNGLYFLEVMGERWEVSVLVFLKG
jgi:Right handed beta helix region/Secretion system C-terminal sorting domain